MGCVWFYLESFPLPQILPWERGMLMHWRPLGIPRAKAPLGRFCFHSPSHFFPSEAGFSLFQVCSWYFLGCQDFLGTES